MTKDILKNTEPAVIYTVMTASILLFAFASYTYIFKKPMIEYSELKKTRIFIQAKLESGIKLSTSIKQFKNQINELNKELNNEEPVQLVSDFFANTVTRLDEISSSHEVQLMNIKPGEIQTIPMFKKIPFDVEVLGRYLNLHKWFHQVEKEFSFLVVEKFEIKTDSDDNSTDLNMKMKIVSYKPFQEKE